MNTNESQTLSKRVGRPGFLDRVKLRTVKLPVGGLVKTSCFSPEQPLPLVITPTVDDFDPIGWAAGEREFIERNLLKHGAILFRRFRIDSAEEFERFASTIYPELFTEYGDLPREPVAGKVYSSTPYPNDQPILFHNESSHMHCWPLKIWFYCVTPPQQGGETPIADCRAVYNEMEPTMRQEFSEHGLLYVRNFSDGLDVNWQDFFKTSDPAVVEEFCRRAGITCDWKPGKMLRTKRRCTAVATHPKTGARAFFNQLQAHHISCVHSATRQDLLSLFGEEGLPRNVYYGNGKPIPNSVVDDLRELYERHAMSFTWQTGDIMMVDNMLVAHGRRAFMGPRKILVTMGEMVDEGVLHKQP